MDKRAPPGGIVTRNQGKVVASFFSKIFKGSKLKSGGLPGSGSVGSWMETFRSVEESSPSPFQMLLWRFCCYKQSSSRPPKYRCLKIFLILLGSLLCYVAGDVAIRGDEKPAGYEKKKSPPSLENEFLLDESELQSNYGDWLSEPPPDRDHCLGPLAFPKETPSFDVSVASNRKYVMPNCEGGIGNQVFCAAAALAYALEENRCLVLSKIFVHPSSVNSVSYRDTVFRNLWLQEALRPQDSKKSSSGSWECSLPDGRACPVKDSLAEVVQPGLSMHWAPFTKPRYPEYWIAVLMGGWQNFWYTWRWRKTIAAYLRPPPQVARHLLGKYPDLIHGVAMHFRRGDFIKSLPQYKYVNRDFPTASDFYYQQALDLLLANVTSGGTQPTPLLTFFILTNDIPWARSNSWIAALPGKIVFVEEDEVYTWYLMMLAKVGLICPNSTFCWWASYIGVFNRFLTLPNHWYNSPGQEPTGIHFPGATVVHSDNARGEGSKPYYPRPWDMSDPDAGTKEEAWPSPEPIKYPLSKRYWENRITHSFIDEATLFLET